MTLFLQKVTLAKIAMPVGTRDSSLSRCATSRRHLHDSKFTGRRINHEVTFLLTHIELKAMDMSKAKSMAVEHNGKNLETIPEEQPSPMIKKLDLSVMKNPSMNLTKKL